MMALSHAIEHLQVATHAEVTDAAQQLTAEPPAHAMKAALAEAKAGSATSKSSADMENVSLLLHDHLLGCLSVNLCYIRSWP